MADKRGPGREHERLPQHPELNEPVDIAQQMENLGKDINLAKQTPEDSRDRILNVLLKYKKSYRKEVELLEDDYSPLKLSVFDFEELLNADGQLDEGMMGHFAIRYIANFSAEGLDFEIGEYQGRYAVYLKSK